MRALLLSTLALSLITAPPAGAALVAWYPFDEGSGSVAGDGSANGNHLSAVNGGVQWNQKTSAPFGGSIHFNGTGSVLAQRLATDIQPQTINALRARTAGKATLAFWANPNSQGQGTAPFSLLDGTTRRILQSHLLWTNNNVYWDVGYVGASGDQFNRTSVATTSTAGSWTHWAFVFDGPSANALKVYRNGVVVVQSGTVTQQTIDWAAVDVFEIGHSQIYGTRWQGSLDDFGLWDEALTATQVQTAMTSGVQVFAQPSIEMFQAEPGNLAPGGSATLSWSTRLASSLSISPGVGTVSGPAGSVLVSPATSTTYTLTATNAGGSATRNVLVGVNEPELPLTVSEFMADGALADEDAEAQDWIEIHNPNPFAVSTAGWKLANGPPAGPLTEWAFPLRYIQPGARLVVFASSKNRAGPTGNLHTSFKLDPQGERLDLLNLLGAIVWTTVYPAQREGASGGLDGATPVFFPTPTPGAVNGPSVLGFVADTTFSTRRGFYTAATNVLISCATPGAVIRYTRDCSTPSLSNGVTATNGVPVAITGHTVLRARAFLTGYEPSNTDTQTYVFLADVMNQIYTSPPAGWPASGVNGQVLRYGLNSTLKAQYSTGQLEQSLRDLPTLSLVTDQANLTDPATGIYVNALLKGDDWERPSTMEWIDPTGGPDFQIHAGLRIRGGYSRNDAYAKHSFRLFFRKTYGEGELDFPLFGAEGTDAFQTLDLRSEQNYHYANDGGTENTAVREVFSRDLFRAMGEEGTRSRYFHLYLNGQYWGLYMFEERAQEDHAASYFGRTADDYDVVQTSNHSNFFYEMASGTADAWQATWNLARACAANPINSNYFALLGRDANGTPIPGNPVYIDPRHLATYMLLHYYTGDGDGPLSNFLSMDRANNWRGYRPRDGSMGWRFFPHDCEHTLQAPSWVNARATNNTTGGSNRSNFIYSNAEWIHEDLALNPEYRLLIADVAQRHLFADGALTPNRALALFDARTNQIQRAIIADAVRWGTSATNHTLGQWQARVQTIRSTFFPTRHSTVLGHLTTRGFYPSATPPSITPRGGAVTAGSTATLDAGAQTGTIYYTLDGSDPRAVGGAAVGTPYSGPIAVNGVVTLRTRFLSAGGVWSALDEVTFTTLPAAGAGNIVISKVHYRPADPNAAEASAGYAANDFEYLELMNISTNQTLDLRGLRISGGVTCSFANATPPTLAPGGRVLVADLPAALAARYGNGLPVVGVFTGNLSNGGEALVLSNAVGAVQAFTYDDLAPWPVLADASDATLVLRDPESNPDPNLPANWRASHVPGGLPGDEDILTLARWRALVFTAGELGSPALESTLWGDAADADGDGASNLLEYALGTNARDAGSVPALQARVTADGASLRLELLGLLRPGTSGLTFTAEISDDLIHWTADASLVGSPTEEPDGRLTAVWRFAGDFASHPSTTRYARLRVTHAAP